MPIDTLYMESALNDILKNLCYKYGWFYGVFWSYDEENPLLLTLKKVYFVDEDMFLAQDMFQKVHVVGDELVGQVAFSGMHSWVSSDTLLAEHPFQLTNTFQQVPSDVQCHFSAGIKTVAVVPIEPRGIAQFGSFAKINESVEFLDEAKRLFSKIETVDERLNLNLLELDQLLSPNWNHQPALHDFQPPVVDACPQISQPDQQSVSPLRPSALASTWYNVEQNTDIEPQESISFDSLGSDDFEILASLLKDQEEVSLDDVLNNHWPFTGNATVNDHPLGNETSTDNFQESNGLLDQEIGHVPLNEALAKSYGLGSNILPCVADCKVIQHPLPSHCQVSTAGYRVSNFTRAQESLMGIKRKMPDYSTFCFNGISSQRLKYNVDWTDLGCWSRTQGTKQFPLKYRHKDESKEGMTKVVKKRAKPGEARHRPKDRVLQQKFYAQLRSLVPDGQKCTQDDLLKRTIRHISFLQNVSTHAEVLKHGYNPKLNGEGSTNDCRLESAETLNYPINVEVLSAPGYYAIEMIMQDGRLPLFESLDMFRGHGLNILNGAMEAQGNKTCAYVIVETVGNSSKEDIHQLVTNLLATNDTQHNKQIESFQCQKEHQHTSVDIHFPHNVM